MAAMEDDPEVKLHIRTSAFPIYVHPVFSVVIMLLSRMIPTRWSLSRTWRIPRANR